MYLVFFVQDTYFFRKLSIYYRSNKLIIYIEKRRYIRIMGVDKTYTSLLKQKYRLYFDNGILDSIISFIYKNSKLRTRKVLQNTLRLFNCMDMTVYEDKPDGYDRIWFIKKTLEAILKKEFANTEMIYQYCLNDAECDENKEAIIKHSKTISPITYEESKWLISEIEDRLNYGYTLAIKDKAQELFNQVDSMDFRSYKSISDQIYDLSVSVINAKRSASSLNSDQTFSLRDDVFEDSVTDSVNKLKDKNKMLITGIKRWNTILAPAYLSKRLYTYLALPGGGKSQILLKTALDIKKYNSHIKASDPNKNPAVLVITMENDIDETVERIFNMVGIEDDIRNYTPKQVIKLLKKEGALTLTEENNIDIVIKYYPNRSIDTNDLYTLISDMNDDGEEVIALILDYLKRIRPAEKGTNEKEELKNITNELKTLAKFYDIPVITAHQLNRNAASVVDAAIQAKKEDIAKLLSRDNVGSAWEINCYVQWSPHMVTYDKKTTLIAGTSC